MSLLLKAKKFLQPASLQSITWSRSAPKTIEEKGLCKIQSRRILEAVLHEALAPAVVS